MNASPFSAHDAGGAAADYARYVRGRRVAVVGPGRSIVGARLGGAIDGHDRVVRLNHGWPVPAELAADLGRRADILYHCCNGDFPVAHVFSGPGGTFRWACFEEGPDVPGMLAECAPRGVHALEITAEYARLRELLGTFPNTGLVAICHLLFLGVAGLSLFGLNFFRGPYRVGYPGDGAAPEHWSEGKAPPARIWEHDLEIQFEYFRKLYRDDARIWVDPHSLALMPGLSRG